MMSNWTHSNYHNLLKIQYSLNNLYKHQIPRTEYRYIITLDRLVREQGKLGEPMTFHLYQTGSRRDVLKDILLKLESHIKNS